MSQVLQPYCPVGDGMSLIALSSSVLKVERAFNTLGDMSLPSTSRLSCKIREV
jgi:hypothetical protein